jgi:uncharacterized membrane protein
MVNANERTTGAVREAKALATILSGIGVLHFATPKMFDDSIPAELPGNPRVYTVVSGVAEFVIAAGLLSPKTRRVSGLVTAVFLVVVYPANLNSMRLWWHKPRLRLFALARLPLQFPMIVAALRVWRRGGLGEANSSVAIEGRHV